MESKKGPAASSAGGECCASLRPRYALVEFFSPEFSARIEGGKRAHIVLQVSSRRRPDYDFVVPAAVPRRD